MLAGRVISRKGITPGPRGLRNDKTSFSVCSEKLPETDKLSRLTTLFRLVLERPKATLDECMNMQVLVDGRHAREAVEAWWDNYHDG